MGKRKAVFILLGLVIIGAILIFVYDLLREPDVFTLTPPWEGEIRDVRWIDNENLFLSLFARANEGETKTRIYKFNPFNNESEEIFSAGGWRLELEILDLAVGKEYLAIKEGDKIQLLDFSGENQLEIDEAGTNTQARFSPDLKKMAFTTFAEWELPTNVFLLDLETWEKEKITDYEFGQNYKAGKIGWDDQGGFFYVEEFAFGTLTFGGQRLYHVEPGEEKELYWEVPDSEQIIGFHFLEEAQILVFFVEWDDDAMETQLFLARFDVDLNQKKWVMALDRMGDQELWKQKNSGYPRQGELFENLIWVTRIDDDGDFQLIGVDTVSGELKKEFKDAGFPRISPDQEWLVYRDFSGPQPQTKVKPLTNSGDLR